MNLKRASTLIRVLFLISGLIGIFLGSVSATSATSWEMFNCDARSKNALKSVVIDGSAYDVVIYGGSPAGVAAARSAAELGKSVLLLSESGLFGGAISNGVSATDLGYIGANVGFAETYLDDVSRYYHDDLHRTEPKVAECIFLNWMKSKKITLGTYTNLENALVIKQKIKQITFHNTAIPEVKITVQGKTFIDASYAGDLMFSSGTKTRLGMADFFSYGEKTTQDRGYKVLFELKDKDKIAQAESDFAQLPQVNFRDDLTNYSSDILSGMPSFTYRLCVTKNSKNKLAFSKTADYETFAPAWRTYMTYMKYYVVYKSKTEVTELPTGTLLTPLWRAAKIPKDKFDLNAHFSSFTNLTMSKDYFDHPESRQSLLARYTSYLQSFLYFIQHDDSVPAIERNGLSGFGLCADEFKSTNGWPQMPYLREGRRLIGKTTVTASDLSINRTKTDSVAVGSYVLDSKPTLFVFAKGTFARDRGQMYRAPIYEIPFSAMLPKTGPRNLVVALGISASPSAFSSIRMEPQFIQLGQAAGIAAALASGQNGIFKGSLAPAIRAKLSLAKGFNGITSICKEMEINARIYWGFDSVTCEPRAVELVLAH